MLSAWLLASHADDELKRATWVATALAAFGVAILVIVVARRLRESAGPNRPAITAVGLVGLSLAAIVVIALLPEYPDVPPPPPPPPGVDAPAADKSGREHLEDGLVLAVLACSALALVFAIVGIRRVRAGGGKRAAVVGLAVALALPGLALARLAACIVSDACLH